VFHIWVSEIVACDLVKYVCQRSVVRDIRLQSSLTDAFLESEVVGGLVDGIEEGCGMSACCAERHESRLDVQVIPYFAESYYLAPNAMTFKFQS
jgi:hypothetical protein